MVIIAAIVALAVLLSAGHRANSRYSATDSGMRLRQALFTRLHLAAPAIVPAGRNIAFETANAASNAPASYLTMMDCCESDEAIADRIAVAGLRAVVRHTTGPEK